MAPVPIALQDRLAVYAEVLWSILSKKNKQKDKRTVPLSAGITAYKDELPPRILVQVKSGDGDIKETTIQSLKGAMREGDYGLFVTLANYTKNAEKYLENTPIIRGINGTELVELIL